MIFTLTANIFSILELFQQTSLAQTKQQRAEFSGQKLKNLQDAWWWNQEAVDAVNDAISGRDVDSNDLGVEVDKNTLERQLCGKALWLVTEQCLVEQRGHRVGEQQATSWIQARRDVVQQDLADELL